MSNLKFEVTGINTSKTKFEGKARQFKIVVDEPESLGGEDSAANPVEFILAGFAGCVNVVAHIVAKELNFNINSLKIEVVGSINPNKFLGISDDERAGFNNIEVKLDVDSDADAVTLQQWEKAIGERCPVKDNLTNITNVGIKINELSSIQAN